MQNIPSDLIQEAMDILHGDNQHVRVYTLHPGSTGGIGVWEGILSGVVAPASPSGNEAVLIDDMHHAGHPSEGRTHDRIPFANIIHITTIQGA